MEAIKHIAHENFTDEFILAVKYFSIFGYLTYVYMLIDRWISKRYKHPYYFIHSINNAIVVYYALPALSFSVKNLYNFKEYTGGPECVILTFALHAYHIIEYFNKLTYYDYLHHGTMCFIALPLGICFNSGSLMDYSLFFLTGLPGAIDYMLLFLVRNEFIEKLTEKKINNFINLWIRCPGSISQVTMSAIVYSNNNIINDIEKYFVFITSILVFWNGIYFMNLVVSDYAIQKYKKYQLEHQHNN